MDTKREIELKRFATVIRIETMKAFKTRGFGHIGGAMSIVELLSVLYSGEIKIDPQNPKWEGRDRFVLSKGHAGPSLYATLALKGYFPMQWLSTLNQPGTRLPSHCDGNLTPGVDMTTGSLGHGISSAAGMALGFKIDGRENRVYAVIGDGECNEGQVWEGALFCAHQQLDNLILFIDKNGKQLDGCTDDILKLGDLAAKFTEFGWNATTVEGNDVAQIEAAIKSAKNVKGKPSCIVLKTIKGAGIKEVEETPANHHLVISVEMADRVIGELSKLADSLDKQLELNGEGFGEWDGEEPMKPVEPMEPGKPEEPEEPMEPAEPMEPVEPMEPMEPEEPGKPEEPEEPMEPEEPGKRVNKKGGSSREVTV